MNIGSRVVAHLGGFRLGSHGNTVAADAVDGKGFLFCGQRGVAIDGSDGLLRDIVHGVGNLMGNLARHLVGDCGTSELALYA